MLKTALMLPALAVLVAVAVVAVSIGSGHTPAAAEAHAVDIGIDMDVNGNHARTVGSIEECGVIAAEETLDIDIVLPDPGIDALDGLSGFQFDLTYDPAVVNISDVDIDTFLLNQATGSFLFPLGDSAPDSDGLFFASVIDFGPIGIEPAGASETGPGVLVRITLTGVAQGTSLLNLENIILPNDVNKPIPVSGVFSGTVAVDEACEVVEAPPTLTVVKVVINDDGRTEEVKDFELRIDADAGCKDGGTIVTSGTPITLDTGQHTVCESGPALDRGGEYVATFSGGCDAAGNVTLELGDQKTCTITNDDLPLPTPAPTPTPSATPTPTTLQSTATPTPTPTSTPTPAVAAAASLPSSGFGEVGDSGGSILGTVLIALGIATAIAAVGYTAYGRRRRVS